MSEPRKPIQKKAPPAGDTPAGSTQDRFSPEYMAYLKEMENETYFGTGSGTYSKEIAKLARDGKLEPEVLKQLREILRDPNKMEKKEYQYFMKALSQGKFPKKGKHALRFLQALEGTPKEKEYAIDLLKRLREYSTGPLTERTEKEALKKLTDLRNEDLAELATIETSSVAKAITETAGINSRVDKAAEVKKTNYEVERLPEEQAKELARLRKELAQVMEKSNVVDREFRKAKAAEKPDAAHIERLKQDLIKIDDEIAEVQARLKEPQLKEQQWAARVTNRRRALKSIEKSGINLQTAKVLSVWLLEKTDEKSALKLAIQTDPSGSGRKKQINIEIKRVFFDKNTREGFEEEAPGELFIEYVNENGEHVPRESFDIFLNELTAIEGHEEIETLEELNRRLKAELGYAGLAPGQEFETDTLVGYDKDNKPLMQRRHFKIEVLDEGKKAVRLDQTVTTVPRQWIKYSVNNLLYFDHKQRDFTFGEFAKFIKRHKFERDAATHEVEGICEKAGQSLQEECEGFMQNRSDEDKEQFRRIGGADAPKFSAPKAGEEKEVLFIDKNLSLRWGKIRREKAANGQETIILDEVKHHFRHGDATVTNLMEAGVSSHFAYTQRAGSKWQAPNEPDTITLKPLELARMVREGSIMDAPATEAIVGAAALTATGNKKSGPPTKKWRLVKQPDRVAAMEIKNKHLKTDDEEEEEEESLTEEEGQHDPHEQHDAHEKHDHADHKHDDSHGHDEHGHGDKHHDPHAHGKKNYLEEALPADMVNKVGGMKHEEKSWLRSMWTDTRFLSMNDLWKMGKSMWEYYDRRWERKQKDKFSRVGEELPYFSPEMRRIVESTEHEEVHQYQEAFEHKGIYEIQYRLEQTGNKDEFKAAFITLSDKGQMRWDSIPLWKNINRFISSHAHPIPLPANGDPNTKMSATDTRTGFDFLKGAIDSIWGESTYDGFFSKNKSAFASNAKGFYEEGDQLEGTDGGHADRLAILLSQHKKGYYVNPHEYEGLILHSIEKGKSSMQAKLYYMLEGVAAVNHDGRTILPFDRMAHINSAMLPRFPILEYLTGRAPRGPDGKEVFRFALDDYKSWVSMFDHGDPMNPKNCKPNIKVDNFLWDFVIPSDHTQNRINKALRNGENLDHDDMFAYLPPASYEVVNGACKATTGSKKFLTMEGYANVFPGFSQYMRSVAGKGRRKKLREAIKSYVRFEGIMTNKYQKTANTKSDTYQRMDKDTLTSRTIVSDTPPQAFIDQLNVTVKKIVDDYDNPQLSKLLQTIQEPEVHSVRTDEGKKAQNEKDQAFEDFNNLFDDVVKTDNGEKMEAIIKGSNLAGMPYSMSDAEKDKRKTQFADKTALN